MTNPMDGYAVLPGFDAKKFDDIWEAMIAKHVGYGLGAKDPTPWNALPIDFHAIDCSGAMRVAVGYATGEVIKLPDGSWNQDAWLSMFQDSKGQKLKHSTFANTGLHDGRIRICTHLHDASDGIGHIWAVKDGLTYESHGGKGPSRRAWNTPVLERICTNVYVVCDAPHG